MFVILILIVIIMTAVTMIMRTLTPVVASPHSHHSLVRTLTFINMLPCY